MLRAFVSAPASLVVLLVGAGCGGIVVLEEAEGGGGGAGPTSGPSTASSASSVVSSAASKSASSQTGMSDPCLLPIGAACDPGMFPLCAPEQVSGVPCCYVSKTCGPSGVAWDQVACTDDCAQACELVTNPEQCEALPWCALGPMGCELAPPPP